MSIVFTNFSDLPQICSHSAKEFMTIDTPPYDSFFKGGVLFCVRNELAPTSPKVRPPKAGRAKAVEALWQTVLKETRDIMAVYVTKNDETTITAAITGEIDHHSARWLRMDIDTAISDNAPKTLRLDFDGVTFMDSSGVGLVMGRHKNMKEIGGKVELVNMPEYIERVMCLAGMNKLLGVKFEGRKIKNG